MYFRELILCVSIGIIWTIISQNGVFIVTLIGSEKRVTPHI